jgi:hypothetical protein
MQVESGWATNYLNASKNGAQPKPVVSFKKIPGKETTAPVESALSPTQLGQIESHQAEIRAIEGERDLAPKPQSSFSLFKQAQFTPVRERLAHLSNKEIGQHIHEMWKSGTNAVEQAKFEKDSADQEGEYFKLIDEANTKVNELKRKIFEIKFGGTDNKAVKPSGKLRFMSAFRFYRREAVPEVKTE